MNQLHDRALPFARRYPRGHRLPRARTRNLRAYRQPSGTILRTGQSRPLLSSHRRRRHCHSPPWARPRTIPPHGAARRPLVHHSSQGKAGCRAVGL